MRESAHVCVHRKAKTEIEMCICECKWRFSSFIWVNRKGWCPPTISSSSQHLPSFHLSVSGSDWQQGNRYEAHNLSSNSQCCIEWGKEKEETKVNRTGQCRETIQTCFFFFFWMIRAYRDTDGANNNTSNSCRQTTALQVQKFHLNLVLIICEFATLRNQPRKCRKW